MIELVVLADDATGALDTGVQFARRGAACYVAISAQAEIPPDTRVAVFDTRSRHDAPDTAAHKITQAVRRFPGARIYKKTDSVLRGNVGPEIAALWAAISAPVCFVPFYPAQGRTTKDGVQYVGGTRVDQSPFARDVENPVREADIVKRLASEGLSAQVVAPPYTLPDSLPNVLVFDGHSDDHLRAAAQLLAAHSLLGATAGCAGFAAHLPVAAEMPAATETLRQPMLIVSGSASAATLSQIERAQRRGIHVVIPEMRHWLGDDSLCAECERELLAGRPVILASAAEGRPLFPKDALAGGTLQARLAQWTKRLAPAAPSLMAVGGDYLAAALHALKIGGVRPLREIAPGVALCRAGHRQLVTKSGGFGGPDLLADIALGGIK